MSNIVEQLIDHWKANGLGIARGNSEAEIADFESRYQVLLPPDMRDYFLQVDGMIPYIPNDQDKEGFTFWPLSRVKTVLEETASQVGLSYYLVDTSSFFIFADYLTWSWAYAIRLSADVSAETPVFIIINEAPVKIADSFSEFVRFYLADAPELYGGSQPKS